MTLASMDEACRLLGIEERRLKQLIRDRVLIEARGADGSRGIPRDVIVKGANGWEPLAVLQGTLTLLADDGFTSDESLEWLYTLQEELGERPIDALVSGRHHRVNRTPSRRGCPSGSGHRGSLETAREGCYERRAVRREHSSASMRRASSPTFAC